MVVAIIKDVDVDDYNNKINDSIDGNDYDYEMNINSYGMILIIIVVMIIRTCVIIVTTDDKDNFADDDNYNIIDMNYVDIFTQTLQ